MGRTFKSEVISDKQGVTLPRGLLHVKLTELKEGEYDGRLIYDLRATVIKPEERYGGESWFQRLFVGTDEDPDCDNPDSQAKSRALRLIKRICTVCDVDFEQDMDIVCEQLRDQEFLARNRPRTRDGETFNNMAWAFRLGEGEVEVFEDETATPPAGRSASARNANGASKPSAVKKAAAKTANTDDDGFALEEETV